MLREIELAVKPLIPITMRRYLRTFYTKVLHPEKLLFSVRGFIYDHFYGDSVINRGGVRFKLFPHEHVSRRIFIQGTNSPNIVSILQLARPNFGSFVDIGSHIGAMTVPIAKGFHGSVLSIEPVKSNHDLLTTNVKLNKCQNIMTLRVAVGDREGEQAMYLSDTNSGDHRFACECSENRMVEVVPVATLDSLLEGQSALTPPILVKIDIQGYEVKALSGASKLLKTPCLIVSEFWPYGLALSGSSVSEYADFVAANALSVYEVPKGQTILRRTDLKELGRRLSGKAFCDIVITNMAIEHTGLADIVVPQQ